MEKQVRLESQWHKYCNRKASGASLKSRDILCQTVQWRVREGKFEDSTQIYQNSAAEGQTMRLKSQNTHTKSCNGDA